MWVRTPYSLVNLDRIARLNDPRGDVVITAEQGGASHIIWQGESEEEAAQAYVLIAERLAQRGDGLLDLAAELEPKGVRE